MHKPLASLSLDLDNKWSYLKTHGDAGWERFPSYLDVVVPRFLRMCDELGLKMTVFVVGQDAALEKNHDALGSISAAGHEIGNHSFHHEPWLHLYDRPRLVAEFDAAEEHIERATGERLIGFRGPGFSFSEDVLRLLAERGYEYDASTFPTFLGPVARWYYFLTARLSRGQREDRKLLFGKLSEGFRPLRPHLLPLGKHGLVEIPVTTMPLARVPIHVSYLLYLSRFSRRAATAYFRSALRLCRWRSVEPSLLLHPLDFLGCDDDSDLGFFPAMNLPCQRKIDLVQEVVGLMARRFRVVPLRDHAWEVRRRLTGQDCHPECSEGSHVASREILRRAQSDRATPAAVKVK
jgi:peptidoglycan/xylan/chitin deacetylase (PgdA/CDA1 family)